MRTTITLRAGVAVAAAAVGFAMLTAVPASSATPSGVTRDMVLTAANAFRDPAQDPKVSGRAVRGVVNRACGVDQDAGEAATNLEGRPTQAGDDADGLILTARIANLGDDTIRSCVIGAVAAAAPGFALNGTATLTVTSVVGDNPPVTRALPVSLVGDVAVTAPFVPADSEEITDVSFAATGEATRGIPVTTTTKVPDKKSTREKRAAKKTYTKRLSSAKKSYTRALKKAGSSKSKKAAAKTAYRAKRTSAKVRYRLAIADEKVITTTAIVQGDPRPFGIATPPALG